MIGGGPWRVGRGVSSGESVCSELYGHLQEMSSTVLALKGWITFTFSNQKPVSLFCKVYSFILM